MWVKLVTGAFILAMAAVMVAIIFLRAAEELCARQKKAQLALIGRVEDKLAERDKHIGKMCEGLADVIKEMKLAIAANGAAAVAWPWEALHAEPCLFGLFLRVSIRHELYRLSGNPYESATNRGGFDFPGAECPTPLRDLRPESGATTRRESTRSIRVCLPKDARRANTGVATGRSTGTSEADRDRASQRNSSDRRCTSRTAKQTATPEICFQCCFHPAANWRRAYRAGATRPR